MSWNATALSSWTRALVTTLDARGLNGRQLLLQAGLDPALLHDPNARYPLSQTTRLWALAVRASGDEALGLDVARHINQTTFHALGYSLLASPSLREAFERLIRYFRIVSDAAELRFERSPQGGRFIIAALPGEQQPAQEAIDAMMSVVIRLCRALAGREFRALEVELCRPAPQQAQARDLFERVFKAPIRFAAAHNSLRFSAHSLEAPLPGGHAELARHNDEILARHLAKLEHSSLARQVHLQLIESLPHGEPSQDSVARALNMSLRNLQRKLAAENTSYKTVLNQTRRELALSYMDAGQHSISQITYLLGFSDTSSFSRAFRRWVGVAPSQYRVTSGDPADT